MRPGLPSPLLRPLAGLAAILCAILSAAGLVWWASLGAELSALEAKGRSDLRLTADRLRLEVQRARDIVVFLSDDPRLRAWLTDDGTDAEAIRETLLALADRSGATDLWLLDAGGRPIAGTGPAPETRTAAWAMRARHGTLGVGLAEDGDAMLTAAPVFGASGRVLGATVASTSLIDVERAWRGDPLTIYFTDDAGRVILSNREELRAVPPQQAQPGPFGMTGLDLRTIDAGNYVPRRAMHLDRFVPTLGVRAHVLLDTGPARALAFSRALAAGAVLLMLGGAMAVLWDRRRRLARANVLLEERVAERTAALRGEVRERREAEAALKRAQAELIQAGKLSALGQMSAGISHELNQPLMAMRSFAQNAATFLDRDRPDRARDNLTRIDGLAERMGRIIRNLSAFARAETRPAVVTDLREVIETALEMTGPRREGVETVTRLTPDPVLAMGGETRLAQVVANLVANAVDAMAGLPDPRLEIVLTDGPPRIVVRDTGCGLSDPDAIFDPFYTTKEVGEGLGMGLSISYGIVAGFGGTIRGRNAARGAEFVIELRPAGAGAGEGAAA